MNSPCDNFKKEDCKAHYDDMRCRWNNKDETCRQVREYKKRKQSTTSSKKSPPKKKSKKKVKSKQKSVDIEDYIKKNIQRYQVLFLEKMLEIYVEEGERKRSLVKDRIEEAVDDYLEVHEEWMDMMLEQIPALNIEAKNYSIDQIKLRDEDPLMFDRFWRKLNNNNLQDIKSVRMWDIDLLPKKGTFQYFFQIMFINFFKLFIALYRKGRLGNTKDEINKNLSGFARNILNAFKYNPLNLLFMNNEGLIKKFSAKFLENPAKHMSLAGQLKNEVANLKQFMMQKQQQIASAKSNERLAIICDKCGKRGAVTTAFFGNDSSGVGRKGKAGYQITCKLCNTQYMKT